LSKTGVELPSISNLKMCKAVSGLEAGERRKNGRARFLSAKGITSLWCDHSIIH
jgi:hypothetical protein